MKPSQVCFFNPPGLKAFKQNLFNRIADSIKGLGGKVIRDEFDAIVNLPDDVIPIIGGSPELRPSFTEWRERGRPFITWDRGYARRTHATWMPRGENGGYYRWTLSAWQMKEIRDVPDDRWRSLKIEIAPWRESGKHIVLAAPSPTYEKVHGIQGWVAETRKALSEITERRIIVRDKESSRSLQEDLKGAHCLITHGSIAAVEAVMLGCPVIVHQDSAAAMVGQTDLGQIENLVMPDRQPWLNSLAYSQYSERELVDGTLWKYLH